MSDYARQNDFSAKDDLAADNPAKIISGQDVDDELDAILTAVNSKADEASPTFTGTVDLSSATVTGVFPAGVIMPYAGSTEPTGWVFCDGSAYDSVTDTTFADLYTAIGNTYGGTDGTDFTVPDLRGRAVFGKDDMNGAGGTGGGDAARLTSGSAAGVDGDTLGASGGAEEHTLTAAQMPSHTHTVAATVYDSTGGFSVLGSGGNAVGQSSSATSSAGSGNAHTNLPPAIVLNYIIKK